MDKWIVKNNTHQVLYLPRNKIRFDTFGETVDLVARTGKTIAQLELDPEIGRELSYKHLVEVEKVDKADNSQEDRKEISFLEKKLDFLISLLMGKQDSPKIDTEEIVNQLAEKLNSSEKEKKVAENVVCNNVCNNTSDVAFEDAISEERMREEALKRLVESGKKPEQNMKNFGKNNRKVEGEDYSDIVDF